MNTMQEHLYQHFTMALYTIPFLIAIFIIWSTVLILYKYSQKKKAPYSFERKIPKHLDTRHTQSVTCKYKDYQ